MRPLLTALFLLTLTTPASAQEADGSSAGPGATPTDYHSTVEGPSPEWTQDRTFPGTRFWKLDAGEVEFEQWWRLRKPRGEDAYHILQTEVEIGLTPRLQLDIYENVLVDADGTMHQEGNQIEARIAFDPVYGRTPMNPVLYLEWHPLHLGPDRAEARVLGGGQLMGPTLVGAVNLFYEQNITDSPVANGGALESEFIPNPEFGVTGAVSYAVKGQQLRVGAELKFALEKELWDDPEWEKQLLIGPNVSARLAGKRLKVYCTVLFGVTDDAKQVDALTILATEL